MQKDSQTFVIATGGPNAAGKSTLIRSLFAGFTDAGLTCFILRSDDIRKHDYTIEQHQALSPDTSQTAYNTQISRLYVEKLLHSLNCYNVMLLDAAHTDTAYREKIERLCIARQAHFIGFKFEISKETCWQRLQARQDHIEFANAASLDAHFTGETKYYTPAWVMLDGEQTATAILQQACQALTERFPDHVLLKEC